MLKGFKIIKKIILLTLSIFLLNGCKPLTDYRNVSYIEMEVSTVKIKEHVDLCNRKPNSMFCTNHPSIGDIQPTKAYAMEILLEMNSHFDYKADDYWKYNDNVYEYLEGDCEDIASTMATHMINDGIDKKYLSIAFRKIDDTTYHVFLAVQTSDAGILHLDYSNSGYPIEPRINFHMKMTDVGIDKWVKGNIIPSE